MSQDKPSFFSFGFPTTTKGYVSDLTASIVVFLVALPLCMGISIASGVPPALGLITGIIGGLVVGFLAGSPLQVSGPAAGLAVIIYEFVKNPEFGLAMLGPVVLAAGVMQAIAGALKLGQWFRAVSPAVIRGMLAGIGVLIFASQFHIMVDDVPPGGGLENLLTIPQAIYKGIFPLDGSVHHMAAAIGILTIVVILVWNWFGAKRVKFLPGALIAVVVASVCAALFELPIQYVNVPENLWEAANWPQPSSFARLIEPGIIIAAVTIAVVASAETLLCATAVDQLHDGPRTHYDRELLAQGLGNAVCGVFGALPMTGVIVRSSANVEAGGKTRLSAILHGAWLLAFVALLPFVLSQIPTSALAAILVYTGYKLLNPKGILEMWRFDKMEAAILVATIVAIVVTNLLYGVMIGFGLAILRLVVRLTHIEIEEIDLPDGSRILDLKGSATFVNLPKLASALERQPADRTVYIDWSHLGFLDHACIELIQNWQASRTQTLSSDAEREALMERYRKGMALPQQPVNPSQERTAAPETEAEPSVT